MQGALDGVTVSVIVSGVRRTGTSEKVREQVLCFFLLAKMMAETASLELVASGRAMNEMKKDGMCVALEKLWTVSTSGSANAAAMAAPRRRNPTAFAMHHPGFSTLSTASSDLSISWSCSCLVLCTISLSPRQVFCPAPFLSCRREAPGRAGYLVELVDELVREGAARRHAALGLVEPFLHPLHELLLLHGVVAGRVEVVHDLFDRVHPVEVNLLEVDTDDESMQLGLGKGAALI
jgi:hypothetical protein